MKHAILFGIMVLLSACANAASSSGDCVVGGCSGQLCVKKGKPDVSTCEWTAAYACYQQYGTCEEQADGNCGWSKTFELSECLKDPENYTGNALRPETMRDPNGADRRNPWQH